MLGETPPKYAKDDHRVFLDQDMTGSDIVDILRWLRFDDVCQSGRATRRTASNVAELPELLRKPDF